MQSFRDYFLSRKLNSLGMMEGDSSSKKKDNGDYGFTDLIFAWSIQDILNEDLYRNKVSRVIVPAFYLMFRIIQLVFLGVDSSYNAYFDTHSPVA